MKGDLKGIKFTLYCLKRAIRHPRSPISYHYCPKCEIRFPASSNECPQCHEKVGSSPDPRQEPPLPWYGSILLITVGAAIWGWSAACQIGGIGELGRVLVYIPMGSLFGMSLQRS